MQHKEFYVRDFFHMQHRAVRLSCAVAQVLFAHPVVSSCYAIFLTSPQYSAKARTILQRKIRRKSRLNFIITFKEEGFS
jgi:hypothetical protein